MLPRIFITADLDGCVFPNVAGDGERQLHAAFPELVDKVQQVRDADGASCIATGRTLKGILNDPLMFDEQGNARFPLDYIVCSVGTEIYKLGDDGQYQPYDAFQEHLVNDIPKGKTSFDVEQAKRLIHAGTYSEEEASVTFADQPARNVRGLRHSLYALYGESTSEEALKTQEENIRNIVMQTLPATMDYKVLISREPEKNAFNVDIMPNNAGKDGAVDWLIDHLQQVQNKPFDAAIVWDDTANGKANMNPEIWQKRGIEHVAVIAPANRTTDIAQHIESLQGTVDVAYTTAQHADYHSQYGGAGGLVEGLNRAFAAFRQLGKKEEAQPVATLETATIAHRSPSQGYGQNTMEI